MTVVSKRRIYAATVGSLAIIAGLAGCTSDLPTRAAGTSEFLVEPVRLSHQVTFASETAEMNPGAPDQLITFLNNVDPDGNADIFLDAQGPFSDDRLDAVAAMLHHLGRSASGSGGATTNDIGVTVTVADDILVPASCMDSDQWPSDSLPPSSCTNALTLVRMVEDPDDLLRGRELGPASGAGAAATAARHLERRKSAAEQLPASASSQQPAEPLPSAPAPAMTQEASY